MSESRWKATVHVGGLAPAVNSSHVHDAFIPFGEIVEVSVPKDDRHAKSSTTDDASGPAQNRGFAYVEFEDPDDSQEAIDNMDGAELFGKTLKCSMAKAPKSATEGLGSKTAVWEQEGWLSKNAAEDEEADVPEAASGDPMQGLEGLDVAGPKPVA